MKKAPLLLLLCPLIIQDAPCFFMPYELMKAYPEAKVILNTRDFDAWNTSFQATIAAAHYNWLLWLVYRLHPGGRRIWDVCSAGHYYFWQGDLRNPRRRHEEHSALIRGLALRENRPLLEWQAQDGWSGHSGHANFCCYSLTQSF